MSAQCTQTEVSQQSTGAAALPKTSTSVPATPGTKATLPGTPYLPDERGGSSLGTTSTRRTREIPSSSSKQSQPLTAVGPTMSSMEPVLGSSDVIHCVNDGGDVSGTLQSAQQGRPSPPSGAIGGRRQKSSPASPLALSLLPLAPPTPDSAAPAAYTPMGLRRSNGHGRGRRESGNSHLKKGVATTCTTDAEDQTTIRSEQPGRPRRGSRGTGGLANFSTNAVNPQQRTQQQRPGTCHSSSQTESSFSSSHIGSMSFSCGGAVPGVFPNSIGVGGSGGGRRHRRSMSGAGGEGVSHSHSRHLQPPTNHSHVNLFVRDLPLELNEEKLRGMFSPFGEIVNSAIMRNIHTGVSLGTAFVRFARHEEAMRAMEAFAGGRPVSGSRRVTVQWARREHDKAPSGDERRRMRKLFIRNVPKDVTQEMLVALFRQFGPVKSVSTHRDTAAAGAVSQPGGGGACGVSEANHASQGGPESSVAGSSIEDRRIAFVTFEMEGVAEQATAVIHNSMPFPSCQGIPLMVKLAEDTPVRSNTPGTNVTKPNCFGPHDHGAHQPHQGIIASVGAQHLPVARNVPRSHISAWSDLPINEYPATPSASPPVTQLHNTYALPLSPGAPCGAPLTWSGAWGIGAHPSHSHGAQNSSVASVLSPPCFYVGTIGSVLSPNGSPPYATLSPNQGTSLAFPYSGQTAGGTYAPRQSPQGPSAFMGQSTPASAPTTILQQVSNDGVADPHLDGSGTPASLRCKSASSSAYSVHLLNSAVTDFMSLAGGEPTAGITASLYDTQELYTMLQQYGGSLSLSSGATVLSPPPGEPPSVLLHGCGGSTQTDGGSSSIKKTSCGFLSYHASGSYSDAAQRSDAASSPLLSPPLQATTTTPPDGVSSQQSQARTLMLPQPRSSALQQQPSQGEHDSIFSWNGRQTPGFFRILPQPRRSVNTNPSVYPNRCAAATAALPLAANSWRAKTLPSEACSPSLSVTSQSPLSRVLPPNSGASAAAAAERNMEYRKRKTCGCSVLLEEEGATVSGVLALRHGPRATSSSTHAFFGEVSDGWGGSTGVGGAGATAVTLTPEFNSEAAPPLASGSTGGMKSSQITRGIHGSHDATCRNLQSRVSLPCGSRAKYPTFSTQSLHLPPRTDLPPAPRLLSTPFHTEQAQATVVEGVSATLSTPPWMAVAAKMFCPGDVSSTAPDLHSLDYGANVSGGIGASRSNPSASHGDQVTRVISHSDAPLSGAPENTYSSSSDNNNADVSKTGEHSTGSLQAQQTGITSTRIDTSGDAYSGCCIEAQAADERCQIRAHGAAGSLDDRIVFRWDVTSTEVGGASRTCRLATVAKTPVPTELSLHKDGRPQEYASPFRLLATQSESCTHGSTAVAHSPSDFCPVTVSSLPTASVNLSGSAQPRDQSNLTLGGGGAVTALYREPSVDDTSTAVDLMRDRTSRAVPGMNTQLPMQCGRPHDVDDNDEDNDEHADWGVYPDFNFDVGCLGPAMESKKGSGIFGNWCDSGSSQDGTRYLRHTQQLSNETDNLYTFMSCDDPSCAN